MDGKRTADGWRRWQVWGEGEAREALAELSRSGESVASYARRRGVSAQRIYYWRKRVTAKIPAFVAVPVATARPGQIEVVADGITIRIREDVDADRLADIVESLGRRRRC